MAEVFRLATAASSSPETQVLWRSLDACEIRILEAEGCRCPDWAGVFVSPRTTLDCISDCRFEGRVRMDLPGGGRLRSSTIVDCDFAGPVIVDRVDLLDGYSLGEGAEVSCCHEVRFRPGSSCGSGMILELGSETGERSLRGLATLTVALAAALTSREPWPGARLHYDEKLDALNSELSLRERGWMGRRSSIRCTALVENVFLGEECIIDSASSVRGCFMLGGEGEGSRISDGSVVRSSALQWGSSVDSLSVVTSSIVGERAAVEKSAKLSSSLLGPDSVHACGEITASLVGPQVAAHHQSLLIAARWPEGCGNVGYGANVGSNHTSRLPDQGIAVGGGVFFGLGCSVKFPCSLENAPGTVVATGVVMPPQKLEFPFSLVTEATRTGEGGPPGLLELRPGWGIYGNLFSLLRNLGKNSSRRRASRTPPPEGPAGPGTLHLVLQARDRLRSVSGKEFYTSADLPGAGACFVTEQSRARALEGYDLYAAWQILHAFAAELRPDECNKALSRVTSPAGLASTEFQGRSPRDLLCFYQGVLVRMSGMALESRARDFSRGSSTIGDYAEVHLPPEKDPVLQGILLSLSEELACVKGLEERI